MPNYCNNTISIKAPRETLNTIQSLVKSDESEFDFNKIIPMPDYIYRGNLGPEEQKIYGKNNWYDWSNENWGTKWNCWDVECADVEDVLSYSFYTAWSPCEPVVKALAEMFPEANIHFRYEESGCCFCGEQEYENGHMVYTVSGDYSEFWFWDEDDEYEEEILNDKNNPGVFLFY